MSKQHAFNAKFSYGLLTFLLFFFSVDTLKVTTDPEINYFQKGLELKKRGEIKAALNIWLNARSQLKKNKIDPRIGFSFIELVTEHRLTELYKTASVMYYWALSGDTITEYKDEIKNEILRIKPLLGEGVFNEWNSLLKNKNPRILTEIRKFWGQLDPTVNTYHNERLLEHWERINYVKNNFTENKNLVYPSDERGNIFIKYGPPDRTKKGTFRFNRLRLQAWAYDMAILNTPGEGIISDTSSSSPSIISNINSGSLTARNLTEKARDYFTNPKYEIWVYQRYSNTRTGSNLIFIFGDDASSGDFRQLDSLEDVIPGRAFNPSIGRSANPTATPGILLQMMLYDQVATADSYFGNALLDLESEALSSTDSDPYLGSATHSKNRFELAKIQAQALPQTSTYEEKIPDIRIEIQEYRMLDNENKPYSLVFTYSNTLNIILSNYLNRYKHPSDKLELEHYAQVRDATWNMLISSTDSPPLVFSEHISSVYSIFILPYYNNNPDLIFGARLTDRAEDLDYNETGIFSPEIIGLGKTTGQFSEPLSDNPAKLEIADLILGYKGILESEIIPFYVPKDGAVPLNKDLMVHFEVYHLGKDNSNLSRFTVKYEVQREKKSLLPPKDDPVVNLTLNYETKKSYFKENLEIATRELSPGKYKLILTITDSITNQKMVREVEFEVFQ